MPNHLHLIAVPAYAWSFARTFGLGHMQYARYRNRLDHRTGHLWQGRFVAAALDETYCSRAMRYVEMNPVRAGLVTEPEDWPWSSTAIHVRGETLPGVDYPSNTSLLTWREFLGLPEIPGVVEQLRADTYAGRPMGTADLFQRLEQRCGKSFERKPRGRPAKNT